MDFSLNKKLDNRIELIKYIQNALKYNLEILRNKDLLLIEFLRKKYNKKLSNKPKNTIVDYLKPDEEIKYYYTSNCKDYHYFVSNYGNVFLVNISKDVLSDEIKEKIYTNKDFIFEKYYIPQNYDTLCLDTEWCKSNYGKVFKEYKFNSSTPVYQMVGDTWLKDEYKIIKTIKFDDTERIELHHIDGNNYNCRADNLIYLPNRIHSRVHV